MATRRRVSSSSWSLLLDKAIHQQDNDNDKNDEPMTTREVIFIPPGKEIESLPSDIWDEIDGAQPSRWWILKEVRL